MSAARLNLYVVDDDEAVRRSLGALLLSRGYATQVFDSGESFLAVADAAAGGCVILDLRLGALSGLQVFEALRARQSPLVVVFLSGHGDIPTAVKAMEHGAFGWLEKPCNDQALLDKVSLALKKAEALAEQQRVRQENGARWHKLTPQEMKVARQVAEGLPNKLIAKNLDINPRTVETHRAHVFAKLALVNSHELGRFLRDIDP
jgi:FixJ family two-component response regulator